ncbi:uncharacterized protein CIMG_12136 [Coccidioides immitis RS]|uniref:Uncharacterized protein n=1 Tax=Coccidioides immitis (strain RS) TaxID=246410 RepID=A0A0D8JUJ7_COCIM|nr:uncharacterized protein CIMG_12136 [Coccidioides immitis RS]KJF60799.1 hypothetical protein CIMG_12136 [Coccidioides immitis RS]
MPDGICFRPGAGFISRDSPLGSLANDKHTSPPSKSHGRKHRVRLPRRALVGSQDRAATQIVVKELDFCLRGLDFMTRGTPGIHLSLSRGPTTIQRDYNYMESANKRLLNVWIAHEKAWARKSSKSQFAGQKSSP